MCSSSSGTNETDVKITEQLSEMDITEHNVSSPGADVYLEAILPNEIFAKITDFLANDHDSLEALYFTSKRMANRIKPFLVEKRKKLLSVFVDFLNANDNSANFLDKCDLLLLKSEKYLKRVLRTNEYLSLRAHNLPMRRLSFVLLGVGDSISEENKLSLEERAHKLLKIAQLHCYEFSAFYDSMTLLHIAFGEENNLSKDSLEKMEQALAYRIFKRFMHKYPILCKFTDVIWPQGMSDEIKKQMAKEFGEENYRTAPKNRATKPRKMGRMFEMRTFGRVRNPSTRPSRERKYKYYSRNRYYYNEYHYNDDYYFDSSGYEYY